MKKILKILSIINFIGINTISLIACNKPQYTEKELIDLKEKNNIITKDGVLEWISPQEKPFNQVDNKWYFIIWRGNKNDKWNITKFKNNIIIDRWHPNIELDSKYKDFKLNLEWYNKNGVINTIIIRSYNVISDWPSSRFKNIYRWNSKTKEPNLIIYNNKIKIKNI